MTGRRVSSSASLKNISASRSSAFNNITMEILIGMKSMKLSMMLLFQMSPLTSLVETLNVLEIPRKLSQIDFPCSGQQKWSTLYILSSVLQCTAGYLIARPMITIEIARPPTIKSAPMLILRMILRSVVSTCQSLESLPYSWMLASVSILEIAREPLTAMDLLGGE